MNYIGNYLKAGPDTSPAYRAKALTVHSGATAELFCEGNQVDHPPQPIEFQSELIVVRAAATLIMRAAPLPFDLPAEKFTASAAYALALQNVGASKPTRDAVDARIIVGVRDGTGRQTQTLTADAWPLLRTAPPPLDTDGDGVPDEWEKAHGLNPADATDAARIPSPAGYTPLELWFNSL